MDTLDLTIKLISFPSYVDGKVDEQEIAEFVFGYLKKLPWLEVQKQQVAGKRFNVIAKDKFPTKILLCNHLDTVEPQKGWKTSPFDPLVKNGKLYGLGSSDTKGNVATLLSGVAKAGPTKGLMLLFYVDEEYGLEGTLKFAKEYKDKLKLELIGNADSCNEELGNSCRGVIEIIFTVQGRAGHAANPANGKNAIRGAIKALENLEQTLKEFKTKDLGGCTTNIAWIKTDIGQATNVIPDEATFGLDIRNPNPKVNAKKIVSLYENELKKLGLKLKQFKINYDFGAWITDKEKLKDIEKLCNNPKYSDAALQGYTDLQILWQEFGKPVCFTFGIGEEKAIHKPNEYVNIKALEKGEKFWTAFITKYCSVQ